MFLIQRIRPYMHRNALNCQILGLNILTWCQSQSCLQCYLSKQFVKNVGPGFGLPGFNSQLYHLIDVQSWAGHLNSQ